jgi:hypothetical protein
MIKLVKNDYKKVEFPAVCFVQELQCECGGFYDNAKFFIKGSEYLYKHTCTNCKKQIEVGEKYPVLSYRWDRNK